ncbi:HAMP domain-containing protein, partial [Deltaproteobacteria bacterium OttesenSCG-928-K17]|nr:HAMP domain-containing protein [Deltaproteobacteria bacterium OttesenSCG-928-K17]
MLDSLLSRFGLGMRSKLIIIFLLVKIIPLIILAAIAWKQVTTLGQALTEMAVADSAVALNDSAVENIERMSTDAAARVADFLYDRDRDILYLAGLAPSEESYRLFGQAKKGRLIKKGRWALAPDGRGWLDMDITAPEGIGVSTNIENNDMSGFNARPAENFEYEFIPLYDEITFIDLKGQEQVKVVNPNHRKLHRPLDSRKKDVSIRENTYVKAETYFQELDKLKPGDIYVSDVIGAYVGTNFIGLYTPGNVAKASEDKGYDIFYDPINQSYAGRENPNGRRFEGIVRWATPVTDAQGEKIGYVSFALNHDHIMEFVDHITPMPERYIELPSAYEGNYAFIWDYLGRNIAHPRHHSITGFDPETGEPQLPWLESSIYTGWKESGLEKWTDYVKDYPKYFEQSRQKKPAPELTRAGLVGLDCRYLNNAPQCTGWLDLTGGGGSGSFYILWSGLYKLNTAAAIPYYTGQYGPSAENGWSRRGFGFVAIGSGLEDFTQPARETEEKLIVAVKNNLSGTFWQLTITTAILIVVVVLIAIWMASFITGSITGLIDGISRFRAGERQFRFDSKAKDEFGTLADSFDDMADSLADSVKNPLTITDMNHSIIYMNTHGLAITHRQLKDVVGLPYGEVSIYPGGTKYDPILALEKGREAEIYFDAEKNRYYKASVSYLHGKDEQRAGYIIETADVTEMVLKQLELERAMNAANRANEHKGEFLARMSHEIRTPMNAIIGLANIVSRSLDQLSDDSGEITEIRESVVQIESSSHHLLGLLNDILDISKIEAGKISLSEEKVNLLRLLDTVKSIITPRCDEKSIDFQPHFDDFNPSTFLSDPLRLRQVLINLLGNAVKFTPELGRVDFIAKKKDQREGESLIEFTVRDNGIGISEAAASQVLDVVLDKITKTLKKEGRFALHGLGTFE